MDVGSIILIENEVKTNESCQVRSTHLLRNSWSWSLTNWKCVGNAFKYCNSVGIYYFSLVYWVYYYDFLCFRHREINLNSLITYIYFGLGKWVSIFLRCKKLILNLKYTFQPINIFNKLWLLSVIIQWLYIYCESKKKLTNQQISLKIISIFLQQIYLDMWYDYLPQH